MNISRITGTSQSTIWSALMALSKKRDSTSSSSVANSAAKVLDTLKNTTVSGNDSNSLINTVLKAESSTADSAPKGSGLDLLKALGNTSSNSSLYGIFESLTNTTATDSDNFSDMVLQGLSSAQADDNSSQNSDLLQSLMSTSNAYSTLASLSGSESDPFSSGSVENILNSFMRVPDLSKFTTLANNSSTNTLDTLA